MKTKEFWPPSCTPLLRLGKPWRGRNMVRDRQLWVCEVVGVGLGLALAPPHWPPSNHNLRKDGSEMNNVVWNISCSGHQILDFQVDSTM